jgi:hypothetical protein
MSRQLTSAAALAVQQEVVARTMAVALDFPSGIARWNASPVSIWIDGAEFLGVGVLGSISVIDESAELRAAGMTVALSGVPRDAVAAAMTQAYQRRPATVWEVVLDQATWQPVEDPIVVFKGRIDQLLVEMGETARVVCRLESRLVDGERARIRRYTDEDQQRAHPGDRFFRFVSATTEKEIVWPAKSFFEKGRG